MSHLTGVRLRLALLAAPGLVLAVAGLLHPHSLSSETADRWFWVHVAGLAVFPLVGLALAELVRGRTDATAWAVRLTAYVYATFYSALDVISGIAAGWVTRELGPGVPRPDEVRLLFKIGTPLGEVGSYALIACTALVLLDAGRRVGAAAWPGVLLVAGAALVHLDHIFAPQGVAGMALLGVGTAVLAGTVLARTAGGTGGRADATKSAGAAS